MPKNIYYSRHELWMGEWNFTDQCSCDPWFFCAFIYEITVLRTIWKRLTKKSMLILWRIKMWWQILIISEYYMGPDSKINFTQHVLAKFVKPVCNSTKISLRKKKKKKREITWDHTSFPQNILQPWGTCTSYKPIKSMNSSCSCCTGWC